METTALVSIHPELDEQVAKFKEEGERLKDYAVSFVVASVSDVKRATEDLSMVSRLKKALEERRKAYTQPLNEYLKDVNQVFKVIVEPIDDADKVLRTKVGAYNAEQRRLQAEAEKAQELLRQAAEIQANLTKQTGEIFPEVPSVPVPEAHPATKAYTSVGDLNTAKVWKFEVVDFALLPNEYKLPDMVKIGKVVRAGASVPGVKSWQEDSLRITTK